MKIKTSSMTLSIITLASVATIASADIWPNSEGDMKHMLISLDQTTINVEMMGDPLERVSLIRYPGESYTHPADVLNDRYYTDRYGWVANGFIDLPAGAAIFIQTLDTDPGLDVYEGGMRSMKPMHTYDPILGTDGSSDTWQWGGTMMHNWYAADALGQYQVTYSIFVGDQATGTPLPGYSSDNVTLYFNAVPAPSALALLGGSCGFLSTRRRRRVNA